MIPKRYEFLIFALIMSLFMSFLMSGVVSLINFGIIEGFLYIWAVAFAKSFLVAFPKVMIVVPYVRKVVHYLVEK